MQAHVFERTRPNGTVLEIRGAPLPDGRGFVTTYTDITERISNEKLIREVNNLMSDAINFSPTFIWETDREDNFTFLQGIGKILGYSGNELLGRTRHECFWHDAETIADERGEFIGYRGVDVDITELTRSQVPASRKICAGHLDRARRCRGVPRQGRRRQPGLRGRLRNSARTRPTVGGNDDQHSRCTHAHTL